jgi:site-specific recombinase XerC
LSLKDWLSLASGVLDLRDRLLFLVLYSTGCSESELISLRYSHLDTKKRTLSFGTEQSLRYSSIPAKLVHELLQLQNETNASKESFIFSSRQSKQLTTKRVQQIIIASSQSVFKKSITPQDIRYIHIYHALLKQTSIISIAKQTGLSFQRLAQIIEMIAIEESLDYRYEL